jgi:hypothetical protein
VPYDENGNWTSIVTPVNGSDNTVAPAPTNDGKGILTAKNCLALVQKEVG